MSSAVSPKIPVRKTRIARLFVPADLKGSSLLPSDPWIISNVAEIFKTNRELRKSLGRIGVFAALTVLAAAAAVTVMFSPFALLAAGGGAAALTATVICAQKMRNSWKNFKKNIMPKVRADIAVRYINMKGAELRNKWKDFFFKKKPQPAGKPAAEKKTSEKKPSQPISAVFDKEAFKKTLKEVPFFKNAPPHNNQPPSNPQP